MPAINSLMTAREEEVEKRFEMGVPYRLPGEPLNRKKKAPAAKQGRNLKIS
jgi:hypothetical protein